MSPVLPPVSLLPVLPPVLPPPALPLPLVSLLPESLTTVPPPESVGAAVPAEPPPLAALTDPELSVAAAGGGEAGAGAVGVVSGGAAVSAGVPDVAPDPLFEAGGRVTGVVRVVVGVEAPCRLGVTRW